MTSGTPRPEDRATPADEHALAALVSAALELREAGRADWLDEACRSRPELRERVRQLVDEADELPGIMRGASESDPLVGRELGGRFKLVRRIGAGAMGVVYLADDRVLGRQVACKVVRHGLMAREQALERFAREARSMAAVQHPAIASIHDRGKTDDEQVYLVMEHIDGASLADVLEASAQRPTKELSDDNAWIETRFGLDRRGESSWVRTVVRWAAELAQGLEKVHAAGVLHRDIKPSNIRVRRDGRPALLDFGIALLDDAESITRGPTSLGTPAYMPPEALTREGRRTRASDVYGLSATLYHMLTLRAPYEGTPTQVMHALATREPTPAVKLRPGLPRDLQAILDKGMHKRPGARYATAAELEADLRAFLEYRPVAARPVSAPARLVRRLTRSRAAQGAFITIVLIVLGTGIVLAANALSNRARDVRAARYAAIMARLPPGVTLVATANRVPLDPEDRTALMNQLDEAVDQAPVPVPARLLRAAFRLDTGDRAGAAQDMAVVADFVATPIARELAARYARAGDARDIVVHDLPVPESSFDRYLVAYHWIRRENFPNALPFLESPDVRALPYAEELYLLATPLDSMPRAEAVRVAGDRYLELVRLESRIERRTAMTAQIAGRMLSAQGRHDDALRACRDGIALAPRAYGLRVTAGFCAFALNRLDEAREHLEMAHVLRPNFAKVVENLVWVEIAERRFDAADALVRDSASKLEPFDGKWLDLWSAVVATYAALDAHEHGETETRTARLTTARAHFDRLRELTNDDAGVENEATFRIASALSTADANVLAIALAEMVIEVPTEWWRLELLATHLPESPSPAASGAVARALRALTPRANGG